MTSLKAKTYIIPLLFLVVILSLTDGAHAQKRKSGGLSSDTIKADTVAQDSLSLKSKKKQALNAPVKYEASDSIVFTQGGYAHLYGKGKVNYEKIELESEIITMNMDSSTVFARGKTDSLGVVTGAPVFKDGETPYESKAIHYNFKSKRGYINNVVTQQGEGYVSSYSAKKSAGDDMFMENGKYTTCDNHEHPHFYLQLTRAKVKPKKNVVFGPAYLVVEDVPLPLAIPFGFFPFSSSYSSGFIMPTYGDEMNRGFYLRDGGYYFAVSDYMDLKLTGEIFTKGSWGLGASTNYNKRYKYSGSLSTNYQVTKTGDKNMPDYSESKDFKINWSHRQDAKASPNSSFSASVNFATSSYEKTNLGSYYNPTMNSQNTKTSSVSYTRSFPEQGLTLSSTFNIAQRTKDSTLAVTLPDLNISLSRLFPFKRKNGVGAERWYEKISMSYTGQLRNSITTKEDKFLKSSLVKDWQNAMNHSIPISATFTLFKYINVTPSASYNERWYTYKVNQSWDDGKQKAKNDTVFGFNRVYNYNASIGVSTKLYGSYTPLKAIFGDKIETIRHVITPTISLSAQPDFGAKRYGYWDSYVHTNSAGVKDTVQYSPYAGSLFGVPGKGKQGNISFDVSNNLEMKIKSNRDSTGVRKISLIDELGGSLSYNMAAATRPWSDLGMRLRLKLSKSYTFNFNTSFATYAYRFNKNGQVEVGDRTEWSYGRFGRFQGSGSSFSYTFDNNTWKKWFAKKDEEKDKKDKSQVDKPAGEKSSEEATADGSAKKEKKAEVDPNGYLPFKMPWSFNISYSFNFRENTSAAINKKTMRYPYRLTHTLSGQGNVKLTDKWAFTFQGSYDFDAKKIAQTTCNITRDLHCWSMTCSLSPFGIYRSYNFTIRANSSMLQDLKWEQRSSASSNIKWY
ncbi:putative LPS assembly protein LptD [uncultured Bacteroides sp.]|uniref:putative LPS assembly protein LptD n=1 Tax=uncultured Bacteroides sp. TaxID=162156 RepID=UPI002AA7B556|nr:putative LPS assembly protein LptD [uncultured Bacteroides sp.]